MKKVITPLLVIIIFSLISFAAYLNVSEQQAIDRSKLPADIEQSKGFQRWITNLKNKGFDVSGDEFRLKDTGEVYNPDWMKVYSYDDDGVPEVYAQEMLKVRDKEMVVYSPTDDIYIDYRNEDRDGYFSNEVRFYGLVEDKIIDLRVLDCSKRANCYFDRAYFVDADTLVVSELSRNIDKRDQTAERCAVSSECTYTFKVHVLDLQSNKRWVFESEPFDAVLDQVIPEL